MRDDLLGYYERELNFLRRMGVDFAHRFPKVAARLLLEADKCEDPHVERLIEAVAFMTGRINLKLDDEFPEITESLLNVLYPHYLAPIPSMSIVRFALDRQLGKLTSGYIVPRGTTLYSQPVEGMACRFRSCYPVTVWPIELTSAKLESHDPVNRRDHYAEAVLRLSLRCLNNTTLSELVNAEHAPGSASPREQETGPLNDLRFYINGEPQLAFPLYELIFNNATRVELRETAQGVRKRDQTGKLPQSVAQSVVSLGKNHIKPVGFEADESMLPHTARSFAGYHLLSEYFAFPQKFLFFDVAGLGAAVRTASFGEQFEILIYLRDVVPPPATVDQNLFQLGCTPVVNLFTKLAEPLQVTGQQHEYHLIADVHRQSSTEIYSVDEVLTVDPHRQGTRRFHPFYSYRHADNPEGEQTFWYATRRPSQSVEDTGSEVYLSLVDVNFNPHVPASDTMTVRATCTNRDLPGKLPFGGREGGFELENMGPLARVQCLRKPTDAIRPPLRRAAQWRLISHLSLNHLSIIAPDENGAPRALQEILLLYDYLNTPATRKQIHGLTRIRSRRVTRQTGERIGSGYVRGVETEIEFDEELFVGSGIYLFASVLERFLGLYASVNSFTQLVATVKQRDGELKRWQPRTGEQVML
ncbi:MAG TPA: type VI secretion system baseplate subunit TssF [Pyrinomonadaceae bacterium]|jgi:type VI secretion system protein ImpG|nr:type VI secretion system baseplate subunit TssF [Pyrinomonadaceae bacterium]